MRACLLIPAICALLGAALSVQAGGPRVVAYEIVNARAIPRSLTGQPGDADAGRQLFFDRAATGCSRCHGSPDGPGAEIDRGIEAPALDGIAERMGEGTLRLWLVAPEVLAPGTSMPGYYALGQRTDVADPHFGGPRLSAGEIEDLVAYLLRQKAAPRVAP